MFSKAPIPILLLLIAGILLSGCQASPLAVEDLPAVDPELIPAGMTIEEAATLASLELVDDYPLYTMTYIGEYASSGYGAAIAQDQHPANWACSLFALYGNPEEILFGRNFDWDFSPGLLLFMDPAEGYASVSMVDLYYLGFGGEEADGLEDLPFEALAGLLDAPYLPFDGMNEVGLAIGMAAVPDGGMRAEPEKETIGSLLVIRKILDGAATIEEAMDIFRSYNLNWGSGPALHYLVADASGRSVLVEFTGGNIHFIENQADWQAATNYLISETRNDSGTPCWRYRTISERLGESEGQADSDQAMGLLEDVSQGNTQWSVLYHISTGEVQIVMGRDYREVLSFDFEVE